MITTAEEVTAWEAARVLGMNHSTLRRAAREGKVNGRWEHRWNPRKKRWEPYYVATIEAWKEGRARYDQEKWARPEGMIGTAEAARRLGTHRNTMKKLVRLGYVRAVTVERPSGPAYFARPEEWERGWKRYREEHGERGKGYMRRRLGKPRERRSTEEVQKRVEELRRRREAFRLFVALVMSGRKLSPKGLCLAQPKEVLIG